MHRLPHCGRWIVRGLLLALLVFLSGSESWQHQVVITADIRTSVIRHIAHTSVRPLSDKRRLSQLAQRSS